MLLPCEPKAAPLGRPLDRRARLLSDDAIAALADSLTAEESTAPDLRALAASVVHHAAALDAAINIGLSWTPTPNPAPAELQRQTPATAPFRPRRNCAWLGPGAPASAPMQ